MGGKGVVLERFAKLRDLGVWFKASHRSCHNRGTSNSRSGSISVE